MTKYFESAESSSHLAVPGVVVAALFVSYHVSCAITNDEEVVCRLGEVYYMIDKR